MRDRVRMEIADIGISLQSRYHTIQRTVFPAYRHFFADAGHAQGEIDLEIDLEMDGMPETSGMPMIFDSEESWAMFSDGENYLLKLQPPVFLQPLWVAKFDSSFRKATMFYGKSCLGSTEGTVSVLNPVSYPLDQILLMYLLSIHEGALLHAAGITISDRGCIFPGRSGAGKSTLSRQFWGRAGMQMLSDDRVILRKTAGRFKAYGTP